MCFEAVRRTEMSRFPCGHAVCSLCDRTLMQRGFLSCPTCRTPREGVSAHEVEQANQQRATEDSQSENVVQMATVAPGGARYQILFFPDQSEGQPLVLNPNGETRAQVDEALRLARRHMQVMAVAGPPRRPLQPLQAVRVRRSVPPYHTQRPRRRGRARQAAGEGEQGEEGEEQGEEEDELGAPLRLDSPMEHLVDGLLSPVSVPDFLARRRRI